MNDQPSIDSPRVVAALEEVLRQNTPDRWAELLSPPLRRRLTEREAAEFAGETLLRPILLDEPAFANGAAYSISVGGGGSWLGFDGSAAARYLVRRTGDGRTAAQAVGDLEALLRSERAECVAVLPLWGIRVDEAINLPHDIALVPFADVPESVPKQALNAGSSDYLRDTIFHRPPECALTMRFITEPVIVRQRPAMEKVPASPPPENRIGLLREVALPLALIGPCAPVTGPSWAQYLDPVIERAVGGMMWTMQLTDVAPDRFLDTAVLGVEPAFTLICMFLSTEGETRARLRLALNRFAQAMVRVDVGSKALDLVIALEAILTGDAPGELTFRTSLRAARLSEGSDSDRLRARAIIASVYDIRSRVVHDGTAPAEAKVRRIGKMQTTDVVDEGLKVGAQVLRRLVLERRVPEWDRFDLGLPPG